MTWAYEKNEGYVRQRGGRRYKPIYRLWKEPHHVYTTELDQCDDLVSKGYKDEGSAAFFARRRLRGHEALHWLHHPRTNDTIFTTDVDEVASKTEPRGGYSDKGVVGYVASAARRGYQPLYRAYDPVRRDHLYTDNVDLVDELGPTLEWEDLYDLLVDSLDLTEDFTIELADEEYYSPSRRVARDLVLKSKVARREYIQEVFDCDDFAHLLKSAFIEDVYDSGKRSMPYAMGILWGHSPPHAMNFVVLHNGEDFEAMLVEPQEGRFYAAEDDALSDIFLVVG